MQGAGGGINVMESLPKELSYILNGILYALFKHMGSLCDRHLQGKERFVIKHQVFNMLNAAVTVF